MLDCRSLEYRHLPIPAHVRLIICNSMVKHEHAGGQYNVRREEVEEGTRILHARWPSIKALRDATVAQLNECRLKCRQTSFAAAATSSPRTRGSNSPPPLSSAVTCRLSVPSWRKHTAASATTSRPVAASWIRWSKLPPSSPVVMERA